MSSVSRQSIFYPLDSTYLWDEIVELDYVFQFKVSVTQNFKNKLCRKCPPVLNPNYLMCCWFAIGMARLLEQDAQNTMTWIRFKSSFLSSGTVQPLQALRVCFGSETSSSYVFVLCQPLWLCFEDELSPHIFCGNLCFSKSWDKNG